MDIRGKKLLVIGGAGLIGSHTVDKLLEQDVGQVVIYDNFARGRQENLAAALRDDRVKIFEIGGDSLHTDILDAAMQGMDGVFRVKGGGTLPSDPQATVRQGALEGSNVNTAGTLIDMIEASRDWDMQVKMMSSALRSAWLT